MDLQGQTVASTYQFLLNQNGSNPITLGNGDAVNWANNGLVTTSTIESYATTAVTAGSGLGNGGTVGSITLDIKTGDGITISSDAVAVNSTVVRTSQTGNFADLSSNQTIGGTKTFTSAVTLRGASNQLVFRTGAAGNTMTLTAPNISANRTYTIPDAGLNSSFVMTNGNQSIGGSTTFTSSIISQGSNNQLTFRTGSLGTNTIILTAPTISANRTYTIPDVSANANFVMSTGNQDIGGTKNFTTRPTVNGTEVLLSGEGGGGGGSIDTVIAGNGLTGGGSSSTVTLDVGQGDGIIVSADDIAVDSTVVRTADNQTIAGIKTFQNQIVNASNANSHSAANSYIAAGQDNRIEIACLSSFIGGGAENEILGNSPYSVICGGGENDVAQNVITDCRWSFIGGGANNYLYNGDYNTVCGGSVNQSYGSHNIIGGGYGHIVGDSTVSVGFSAIFGGQSNKILSDYSVIAGGFSNEIQGASNSSSIVGGQQNTINNSCNYCFIGGGSYNEIQDVCNKSSILGGQSNFIGESNYSVILGGSDNFTETSEYSLAFGRKVRIFNHGESVISDSQDRYHDAKGTDTLSLDFANGVYIPTGGLNVTGQATFDRVPTVNGTNVLLEGEGGVGGIVNTYKTGALLSNFEYQFLTSSPNPSGIAIADLTLDLTSGNWLINANYSAIRYGSVLQILGIYLSGSGNGQVYGSTLLEASSISRSSSLSTIVSTNNDIKLLNMVQCIITSANISGRFLTNTITGNVTGLAPFPLTKINAVKLS